MAAPALPAGPPKFAFGGPNKVIALVDTRHDFKGFSQDIVSKPRNVEGEDYVQHFHNNLQRISLGLEEEYSRRLTSRCNLGSNEVMTIGPEQEFLDYIVTNVCNNNPHEWQIHDVNLTDYATYHKTIAERIYGNELPHDMRIPLVVDTHRTLSHDSRPYFIICKNKESVADPSRTSMQSFDNNTFEEFGTEERTHEINTIIHKLNGELNSPTVTYTFPSGYSETLQFNIRGGHKPNEINVCKTRIQSRIKELNIAPGVLTTLATVDNPAINYCTYYDNIQYQGLLEPQSKKDEIAFSYIVKRAGDQLQVLSCRQNITYTQLGTMNNYRIQYCVFWTIDAIAACFAILKGITTVIQHPDKSVTIYRKNGYTPNIVSVPPAPMPLIVGGKIKKYKKKYYGGAPCTPEPFNALLYGNEHPNKQDCWYYAMQRLCDIEDDLYEPWTLLNFLVYYLYINDNTNYNNLISLIKHPNFVLSNDNCFGLDPNSTNLQQFPIDNINPNNRILVYINHPYSFIIQRFPEGLKFYINFISYSKIIPISDLIPAIKPQFNNNYYNAIQNSILSVISNEPANPNEPENNNSNNSMHGTAGGGKRLTFYDNWNELKSAFDIKKANKLFIDFIQLLSLCETLYFQNIDSADNFYVYDPKSQVYIGGHTQIEFLAFLNGMINMYNNSKNNSKKFEAFLKMFIHFPTLLNKTKYNTINRNIYDYISCWFNYQVNTDTTINTNNYINNIFIKIIKETENECKEIYKKLSKDNHEASQYLHSIFPHGYFTIKFNEITNKPSNTRVLKINRNLVNTRKRKRNNGSNGSKVTNRVNNYNRISGGKHTRKRVK